MAGSNGKKNGKGNGKARANGDIKRRYNADGGKFLKGNPGRPKGSKNKSPNRIRAIRDEIVMSWDRVGANEKLDALAYDNFEAYCKIVTPLLPRITELEMPMPMVAINPQIHCKTAINFIAHLEAAALNGEVDSETVLELLDQHAKGKLPALPVEDA